MKFFLIIQILFCVLTSPCYAVDVLYIGASPETQASQYQLNLICNFYGLDIDYYNIGKNQTASHAIYAVRQTSPNVVILHADALSYLKIDEVFSSLEDGIMQNILFMILGVTPQTDKKALSQWSGGTITNCISSKDIYIDTLYVTEESKALTAQLADLRIPINRKRLNYLLLDNDREPEKIIGFSDMAGEKILPIFIRTKTEGKDIFFTAKNSPDETSGLSASKNIYQNIHEILPMLVFLRHAFGERCWHSNNYFANLTIDDPWLIEPYGYLNYAGLLVQMKKSNFHTTIAYIPWNYDRDNQDVIHLFRKNRDNFSVCIHGNNHDHYEFYKYKSNPDDPWPSKPLKEQERDIQQALARMVTFSDQSNISHDKVMVFPHGIAPEKTLGLLKKYNFLSTVNADNIPLGSKTPNEFSIPLRSVTLHFENFSSIKRYPVFETDRVFIALNLFLGNPILLYAHHNLFKESISSFNETALIINELQPNVIWQGLGYICRHWYLERLREDGNYDVLAFFNDFFLKNTHTIPALFYIQKEETFIPPIANIRVNGYPHEYTRSKESINLVLSLDPGETKRIHIEYENDLNLKANPVEKTYDRIALLRTLSDFRDIYLSRNIIGEKIITLYYETNNTTLLISISCIILVVIAYYVLRHRSKLSRRFSSHEH